MKALSAKHKKYLVMGAAVVVAVYLGVVIWAYVNQRNLMYHPDKVMQDPMSYGLQMAAFTVPSEDQTKIVLWYRPANPTKATLVFFHGNAGNLGTHAEKLQTFLDEGYGLLAVSYRGFGTSEGSPTEAGLYQDARTAMRWVLDKGVLQKQLMLYGESLGAAVAVKMASEFTDVKVLILEAPFSSMASVARVHYPYLPVSLLLKDRFDSKKTIQQVHVPVLIAHGTNDTVVPMEEGKALLEAANEPKKGDFIPGFRHDNVDVKAVLITMKTFVALSEVKARPATGNAGGIFFQPHIYTQPSSKRNIGLVREKTEPVQPPASLPQN